MEFEIIGKKGYYKVYKISPIFRIKEQLAYGTEVLLSEGNCKSFTTTIYKPKGKYSPVSMDIAEDIVKSYINQHTVITRLCVGGGNQ